MGRASQPSASNSDDHISRDGLFYMALLALQFGFQPILNKEFLSREANKTVVVLVSEITKFFVAAFIVYFINGNARTEFKGWTLRDSLKTAGLPAVIYSVQNILMLTGYNQLDGLTLNLINQTKTIFTAIAVYLVLNKKQSPAQCLALVGMFGASVLLASSGSGKSQGAAEYHAWLFGGVIPVFAASILSGVASAITQRNLQRHNRSSYLFSMELAVYSSIAMIARVLVSGNELSAIAVKGPFYSFPLTTMAPILLQSCGGIIVGLVVKHAGGVRKGFSILAGILLTGLIDNVVAGNPLTTAKLLALPLVLVSTYVHITRPYRAPVEKPKTN
eukprot:m.146572 g.146572  ORF g.146572 m.146572 type:complete len:332 (-) comp16244_c0_seq7:968-1963(-)